MRSKQQANVILKRRHTVSTYIIWSLSVSRTEEKTVPPGRGQIAAVPRPPPPSSGTAIH